MKSKTFKIPNSDSFRGKESIGAPKKIGGSIIYGKPRSKSEAKLDQDTRLMTKYSCLRDGFDSIANISAPLKENAPIGYLRQSHLVPELFIKPYYGFEEIYHGVRLIDMAEMEAIVQAKIAELEAAEKEYENLDHVARPNYSFDDLDLDYVEEKIEF